MEIGILILAFILRLPLLTHSLWLDEAIQALALMGARGSILTYALADFQPPLYHFLLLPWTKVFGFSELSLRFPALISGVLIVHFGILIGKKLNGRRAALVIGTLLATNPLLIYYSGEGRTYSLTALFMLISLHSLLNLASDRKPQKKYLLVYILSTTLALWSSYLVWIGVSLQSIILIRRSRLLAKIAVIPWVSLLFWIPSLTKQLTIGLHNIEKSSIWGQVVGGFDLKKLPLTWIKFILGRVSFLNKSFYAALSLFLFVFHGFALLSRRSKNYAPLYLLLLTIPLAVIFSAVVPVYQYFRVLFVLPPYLVLLGLSLADLKSKILTSFAISIQILALVYYYNTPAFHKEQWKEFVSALPPASPSIAIALPSLEQNAPLEYYRAQFDLIEPRLLSAPPQYSTVFYINYAEDIFDPSRIGPISLRNYGFTLTSSKVYNAFQVDEYTRQ